MANITKEFLEEVLGEKIASFELNSGSNLGDGYTSLLYSIDVNFPNRSEQRHLLLKCYPVNPGRQEWLSEANLFQKELGVYNTLIPAFLEFQKQKVSRPFSYAAAAGGGRKEQIIIQPPFPAFVYGRAIDYSQLTTQESKFCANPLDNCIIMPDLRKTGNFRLADRRIGFDLAHCQLVIQAQAKFHAMSWCYKKTQNVPRLTTKFPFLAGSFVDTMEETIFNMMFDSNTDLFKGSLDGVKDPNQRSVYIESLTRARRYVKEVMSIYFSDHETGSDPAINKDNVLRVPKYHYENEEPWLVAVHGDSWLNNMMFRYDEKDPSKPLEVLLVDLQLTHEGDPMADLVYTLFTSTTAAFRKLHVNELLQLYLQTFYQVCENFNVVPLPGLDTAELERRFHRAKAFGFCCCLMGFPLFLNDPANAKDMEQMKEGATTEDMMNEFKDMMQSIKGSGLFAERVVDVVQELYAQGVI